MKITPAVLQEIKSNFEHAQQEIDDLKRRNNMIVNLVMALFTMQLATFIIFIIT